MVEADYGGLKVISPLDDTPAARAKIKPNDMIAETDGGPCSWFDHRAHDKAG